MMKLPAILLLCLALDTTTGCQNAIPTVSKLETAPTAPTAAPIAPKDPHNFMQVNSGSRKRHLSDDYTAVMRVGQPLANIKATASTGETLSGTITLAR